MNQKSRKKMSVEDRRQYVGLAFLTPWLIGVTIFFLVPLVSAIVYVFCDIKFSSEGIVATFCGLDNIRDVYMTRAYPIQCIARSLGNTLVDLIVITLLSFFLAVLLNMQFKGRAVFRTIFSMPVIVASGALLQLFKADLSASSMLEEATTIFQGTGIEEILISFGLSADLIASFVGVINTALDLIWRCGVQTLLFLAGMQSIPGYLNEVCDLDGATAWQKFWKVTVPLTTPYLIINVVYTIVDSATYYDNLVMREVGWKFDALEFGYCNALSFGYCLTTLIMVAIVYKFLSKRVVYLD